MVMIRCDNGFFIQVHYESSPFLLNELVQSVSLQVNTLHMVGGSCAKVTDIITKTGCNLHTYK